MERIEVVGKINKRVIDEFNLNTNENQEIFCGQSNREHMKNEHPKDYEKYGNCIEEIISNPTYIAKHPKKDSIEYIKVYITDENDYVLVAVRATGQCRQLK